MDGMSAFTAWLPWPFGASQSTGESMFTSALQGMASVFSVLLMLLMLFASSSVLRL